jgi:hypothetical protein
MHDVWWVNAFVGPAAFRWTNGRAAVFTVSLAGREDAATGGAS